MAAKAGTTILAAIVLIWALSYSTGGGITGGLLYKIGKVVEPVSMRFTALIAGYYFLAAMVIAGIAYRIGLMIF